MSNPGRSPRPHRQSAPRPPRWLRSRSQSGGKSTDKSTWDWRSSLANFLLTGIVAAVVAGLVLAYFQHQSDQNLSRDQERATILQTYINNIQDLVVNHKLASSTPGTEVSQVAKVQTITTLQNLDAGRNKIVLQFLQDAHLIGIQNAVINLSNAYLSDADLSDADLTNVDLNSATLTDARLNGANLYGANLDDADLSDADLSDANLSNAAFTGAFLAGTVMTHSILNGAYLSGAILTGANLNGAYLNGAELNEAVLTDTNLSGTDLSDADLDDADLTQYQLDTVKSCTNAILYTGLTCNHNVTITLTYWYTESPAEQHVILKLIHQFEQQNPMIHINAVNRNYYQTEAAFEDASHQGKAPDILRSDVSWVAQLASQNYLLNIDPYINQGSLSDYLSTPLSYDHYAGHYYGLPQVTDFLALLYNKAELKEAGLVSPPVTMFNFATDARVVHDRTGKYGFETNGTSYNALPFLYAFGGGMLDQRNNNIIVNNAGSLEGLNFLLDLQNKNKGVMPENVKFSSSQISPIVYDFMIGKTAMIFDGPYDVQQILTGSSFKGNPDNLGIASIPTCPAGMSTCRDGKTGSPSGGQSYVISASTLHPIEASKFISFMSSTPSQIAIAEANHTLPTRRSAYQGDVLSNPFISDFHSIQSTAVPQPDIPQAGRLFDSFDPSIAAALDGIESPTAALNAVADAWKQLLAGS